MRSDATFQSLEARRPGPKRSCPVCGDPTAGTVQVSVSQRPAGKKPKMLTSFSRALCERHAVELFRECEAVLNRMLTDRDVSS